LVAITKLTRFEEQTSLIEALDIPNFGCREIQFEDEVGKCPNPADWVNAASPRVKSPVVLVASTLATDVTEDQS
jgi:hypothetical protein